MQTSFIIHHANFVLGIYARLIGAEYVIVYGQMMTLLEQALTKKLLLIGGTWQVINIDIVMSVKNAIMSLVQTSHLPATARPVIFLLS